MPACRPAIPDELVSYAMMRYFTKLADKRFKHMHLFTIIVNKLEDHVTEV